MAAVNRGGGKGLSTLELAVVLPIVLALLLAIFDAVNIYRTQRAVEEAARQAARAAANVGFSSDESKMEEASGLARREVSVILPRARFDCGSSPGGAHCAAVTVQPPQPGDTFVNATIDYNLPLMILRPSPRRLTGSASDQTERGHTPAEPPVVKHSDDWKE